MVTESSWIGLQGKLIAVINSQIRTISFQQHIRCSISTGIVIVSIKLHNFCGYRYINIQHPCALTADWCHNNRIALPLWGCDITCSVTNSDCCSESFQDNTLFVSNKICIFRAKFFVYVLPLPTISV